MNTPNEYGSSWKIAQGVGKTERCVYYYEPGLVCNGWAQVVEHVLPSMKKYDTCESVTSWNHRFACSRCNSMKSGWQSREFDPEALWQACEKYGSVPLMLQLLPVERTKTADAWITRLRRFMEKECQKRPSDRFMFDAVELAAAAITEASLEIQRVHAKWMKEKHGDRGAGMASVSDQAWEQDSTHEERIQGRV